MIVNNNGDTFNEDEIISNVILLFAAGHETTSNMIGNALISLHRHPDPARQAKGASGSTAASGHRMHAL
jgi:cytochrome P450